MASGESVVPESPMAAQFIACVTIENNLDRHTPYAGHQCSAAGLSTRRAVAEQSMRTSCAYSRSHTASDEFQFGADCVRVLFGRRVRSLWMYPKGRASLLNALSVLGGFIRYQAG